MNDAVTPEQIRTDAAKTYERIRVALINWNWNAAADAFGGFCETYRAAVPEWAEDEYAFCAMKLWAAGRQAEVLRHFASFFERALGGGGSLFTEEDAQPLRTASSLIAA